MAAASPGYVGLALGAVMAAALIVLVALQVGTAVPSSPGRIGVFEYICVLSLAPFGVEREMALAYGLVLHAVAYGPPLVVGAALLAREGAA